MSSSPHALLLHTGDPVLLDVANELRLRGWRVTERGRVLGSSSWIRRERPRVVVISASALRDQAYVDFLLREERGGAAMVVHGAHDDARLERLGTTLAVDARVAGTDVLRITSAVIDASEAAAWRPAAAARAGDRAS